MAQQDQKAFRDRQFNVAVTAAELDVIRARAAARGVRPVDYGRARLLSERLPDVPANSAAAPQLDPLLLNALSRLGSNLNQVARRLNTLDQPAPATLEPLLVQIRALINRGLPR